MVAFVKRTQHMLLYIIFEEKSIKLRFLVNFSLFRDRVATIPPNNTDEVLFRLD